MKRCTACGEPEGSVEFNKRSASPDGLQPLCKTCQNKKDAAHYLKNREKLIAQASAYVQNNREKYNAYRKVLQKRKMANPVFRMSRIIRSRLNHVLKGRQRTGRSVEYLGCTFDDLKAHIEAQFEPGMTWENHGTVWHVDHREPLANLPPDAPDAEIRRLSHYMNLRPLWAELNMSEGGKLRYRKIR